MDATRSVPPEDSRSVALVGLMGAGKSVVAFRVAARLGLAVVDVDQRLEAEEGMSVAQYFAARGEAAFRRREADLIERALAEGPCVLACGGGAVLDPSTRSRLREQCRTVWLEVTPRNAAERVAVEGAARPLLAGASAEERLAALLAERSPWYEEVARARIATDGRTPEQVAEAVLEALARLEKRA